MGGVRDQVDGGSDEDDEENGVFQDSEQEEQLD